jgi:hypothetical protein
MNYAKQTKSQLIDHLNAVTEEQEATTVRYAIVLLVGLFIGFAIGTY